MAQDVWAEIGTVRPDDGPGIRLDAHPREISGLAQRLEDTGEAQQGRQGAKMLISTGIRHWLTSAADHLYETKHWINSEGHGGTVHNSIPDFRFERSLEQVTLLEHKTATAIFNVVHKKDGANGAIKFVAEFQDKDDMLDEFRRLSAELYIEAREIHREMAKQLGWLEREAGSDEMLATMHEEIDRAQKRKSEAMNAAANLLDTFGEGLK